MTITCRAHLGAQSPQDTTYKIQDPQDTTYERIQRAATPTTNKGRHRRGPVSDVSVSQTVAFARQEARPVAQLATAALQEARAVCAPLQ